MTEKSSVRKEHCVGIRGFSSESEIRYIRFYFQPSRPGFFLELLLIRLHSTISHSISGQVSALLKESHNIDPCWVKLVVS